MIKTIEELRDFVKKWNDADKSMTDLWSKACVLGANPRWGYIQSEFERVGIWEEYNKLEKFQDALMEEHDVGRYTENFGDDGTYAIFEFLTTLIEGESPNKHKTEK